MYYMLFGVEVDCELCYVFGKFVVVFDESLILYIEKCELKVLCKVDGVVWFDFVMLCGGLCL